MLSSTQGVINSAFDGDRSSPLSVSGALKRLRRLTNTERGTTAVSQHSLAAWAALKFGTEFSTLLNIYCIKGLDQEDAYTQASSLFTNHCNAIADFTLRHILMRPDKLYRRLLAERFYFAGLDFEAPLDERTSQLEEIDPAILYFFYSHGN